jgi:FKBP-type peptidyl-prolyl cis-trans isomerase FkpA
MMRTLSPDKRDGFYYITPQSNRVHCRPRWKRIGSGAGLLVLACLGLAGCGGGGGGVGTAPVAAPVMGTPAISATPAAASLALSAYAGTWFGACQGRSQDTATLAMADGGAHALRLNLVRNFHAAEGCAGTALASETLSADFTLAYDSTRTTAALLTPGTAAAQVTLDLVTISIPAYTRSRSGPAVTTTTGADGVRSWCIGYPDGTVCTADAGTQAAASAPGALYLDKGELLLLSPSGGGYVADGRYTKERATTVQAQGPAFQRIDTVQGSGALATSGRTLTVHYTGWLYDAASADFKGTQFDTSIGKTPFSFRLGGGQVIAGWDQGLLGMRAGGKRTLIIPASLAYGRSGSGTAIPPDAPLLFEVELISVQ